MTKKLTLVQNRAWVPVPVPVDRTNVVPVPLCLVPVPPFKNCLERWFFSHFSICCYPNQLNTLYTHQNHSIFIFKSLFYSNHLSIHMFLQKPFMNYSQATLIWVITHTQTKHKDLLGFVLNPNSITCNLTMNPTSNGGFHTLDPIRIYFRVRFLTTHNPQTCIIHI